MPYKYREGADLIQGIRYRRVAKANRCDTYEIWASESDMYHIFTCQMVNDEAKKEYVRKENVMCVTKAEFKSMQPLQFLEFKGGFDEVEILHDPTLQGAIIPRSKHFCAEPDEAEDEIKVKRSRTPKTELE